MNYSSLLPFGGALVAFSLGFLGALPLRGQVVINELMFHPPPAVPEQPAKEWLELYNSGTNSVDLNGWRLAKGVDFTFTNVSLPAGGYVVVAANVDVFQTNYPSVANVVGNWVGKLRNSGETIELVDASGRKVDSVHYTDDGDWALRRVGELYPGKPTWWSGWQWTTPAAGLGRSLELLNPAMPNDSGQNWTAGLLDGGTPGQPNSVATNHVAPFISDVRHFPAIPRSTNTVSVTARIQPEAGSTPSVSLFYRLDGATLFGSVPMSDDGLHDDGTAGDGLYGAILPAQADKTIVEFYVRASDDSGHVRTWPAPTDDTGTQACNALYQVDEFGYSGTQPVYRLVVKASEWSSWLNLMDNTSGGQYSDAAMNGTVIRVDGTGTEVRYRATIRNRGVGTRAAHPHNMHVAIPAEVPLGSVIRLNFNTRTVHSQVGGNALFTAAGMLNAYGAPVQLRINGNNLANATPSAGNRDTYQFGSYYCFEPYDSDWAANHVPQDSGGNVYKGVWYMDGVQLVRGASFDYLGTNVALYKQVMPPTGPTANTGPYIKGSNQSEDDWSDLIAATYALSTNTPDASYVQTISQVVDIDEWLQYFAMNALLVNMETTLGTGVGDDYSSYRGVLDPRFKLLNHDMDTVLGQGDSTPNYNRSIFKAGDQPAINRFLKHPEVAPRYFATLKQLSDTVFDRTRLGQVLDEKLKGWVPDVYIQPMKDAGALGRSNVLYQIPQVLTVQSSLTLSNSYPYTTVPTASLTGMANAIRTRTVLVDGVTATYTPWQGAWSATGISLTPGINRVTVQTLDTNGVEFARTNIELWYDDGSIQIVGGTLTGDTTWTAAGGPYSVTSSLTIPNGVTLTIEPGTSVYLGSGVNFTVADGGRLLAEGTLANPIRFGVAPGSGVTWGQMIINGAPGSPETRLVYTHLVGNGATCIEVAAGTVFMDHVTFGTTTRQYLALDGASFVVQDCVFPSGTALFELVHGTQGIKAGGRGIIQRNFFGIANSVTGNYNDVIDFTGGNRPSPIIQFYDNVFIGSGDDCIDLDGTDAWIEGNIFMHAHKNGSADTSSAISGGEDSGNTSEVTIIGNLIYDCDHAALAKQGNFFTFLNNTIVHQSHQGGTDTEGAVICMQDNNMTEGAGAYFEGNVIYDAEALVRNRINAIVTFTNNLMPLTWTGPGGGNSTNDPCLSYIPDITKTSNFTSWAEAQVVRSWFSLRPGSPGLGTGPNGRDKGGNVPLSASISGEPASLTSSNGAILTVGTVRTGSGIPAAGFPNGSGYTHYRWRLDGGAWSGETPTTTPIVLSSLANGPHYVEVSGKRDCGFYQDAPEFATWGAPTPSKTWTVDTGFVQVRLNEILARNATTLVTNGESPDLVELYNPGATAVDLSGKGLTDDPLNPYKFTFAPGTVLGAGRYLVLFADVGTAPSLYLGFGFNQNGDELYLVDSPANGSAILDSVRFGPQLPDFSIGRVPDGSWSLCKPTFGSANIAQPTGDITGLKINEWLASGSAALPDDFVELFNPAAVPVGMGGLFLTDAPDGFPARNPISPLSYIAARGFFAFKADGNTNSGPEHLNFSLAAEMGTIGLFTPELSLIDSVFYGPQTTGISEGRTPNGAMTRGFFGTPTPGSGNPGALGNVTNITTTFTFLQLNSPWRYYTNGIDLGTAWRAVGYPDSSWPVGNGLFGLETSSPYPYPAPILTPFRLTNSSGAVVITYYFRTTFNVPTNLTGFSIDPGIYLDDGAVFYLNGSEVGRIRLPSGTISYSTLATNQPSEGVREAINIPASALLVGVNTLAVEVHNTTTSSSDIAFGMSLAATYTQTITNYNTVVLNEILADNGSFANPDGTVTDWVELYNPASNAVSLAGFSLTDDVTQPLRWVFPPGVTVPSKSFLVVRCDPNAPASVVNGAELNTGFGLNSSGDGVYLFDSSASLADSVTFGPQATDFSIGHVADGAPGWTITLPTRNSPNIAAAVADPSNVRINEWAPSVSNGPDWFELYNPSLQPVALGGYYLTDKLSNRIKHQVAPLTFVGVSTNAYLKFVADSDTAQGPNHVNFSMDGTLGEALGLFPPGTAPAVDTVTFAPMAAGISEGRLPDGAARRVFFPVPSPGDANWLPLTNIVINEVLTHTDLPLEDAIELYNNSGSAVDLSGWFLSDSSRNLTKFRIPDGTMIAAGGFKTFYEYQFNPNPLSLSSFSFSSAKGDEAWLVAVDNTGTPTGYRDWVKFGPQFNGVSFGRFNTSVGPEFASLSALSFGTGVTAHSPTNQIGLFRTGPGAPNAYPAVGPVVLSEIMYRPVPVGSNDNVLEEFIELHNLSGAAVPLYDVVHPTNRWRLRDAVSFDFASGQSIPAGGYLVVVGFDPATNGASLASFRSKYGTGASLVGPWSGKLANSGEAIELQAPDNPQTTGPDIGLVPYVTLERIAYSNTLPWPTNADGTGYSLQRVAFAGYGNEPTNWVAALPNAGSSGLADTDGDGMPDAWEEANGLNKLVNDAALDPDHDGFSNIQEYLAGTNPLQSNSFLRMDSVSAAAGGVELRFVAVAGRSYSILYREALGAGPWQKLVDVPAQSFTRTVVISDSGELGQGGRFYRLTTPQMP